MGANLATALLTHGRIQTTEAKARLARGIAEKAITLAKENTLHSRRQAIALLRNKDITYRLFDEIGPAFADVQGGYTRVLKLGPRQGDAAPRWCSSSSPRTSRSRPHAERAVPCGSCVSTWSTTERASPAGPPSRGCAPWRATLRAALATLLREPVELVVAGRTDAGVHACGQVASVATRRGHGPGRGSCGPGRPAAGRRLGARRRRGAARLRRAPRRAGAALRVPGPPGPAVAAAPRRGCCTTPAPLDADAMARGRRACVVGRHDFRAFTPTRTEHVFFDRTVSVCALGRARRRAGAGDRGRRLPAPHGARAGRDPAAGGPRPLDPGAGGAPARGRPARRGGAHRARPPADPGRRALPGPRRGQPLPLDGR